MTPRDIEDHWRDLYGVAVSAELISTITNKVMPLVEAWQNRPLAAIYPIIYLDALYYTLRKDHKVATERCTPCWLWGWTVTRMYWGTGSAMVRKGPALG